METLEQLVEEGKIRAYGWSTDTPERAAVIARGPNCCAVQQELSVVTGRDEVLKICEENNLASINRSTLATPTNPPKPCASSAQIQVG